MQRIMDITAAGCRRGGAARGLFLAATLALLAAVATTPAAAQNLKLGKQVYQKKINIGRAHV